MAGVIGVLASLVFIGWLVFRAVRGKPLKANQLSYGVAVVAGVFTYAYFLGMDMPKLIKILASIVLGIGLIVIAAYMQRRQPDRP